MSAPLTSWDYEDRGLTSWLSCHFASAGLEVMAIDGIDRSTISFAVFLAARVEIDALQAQALASVYDLAGASHLCFGVVARVVDPKPGGGVARRVSCSWSIEIEGPKDAGASNNLLRCLTPLALTSIIDDGDALTMPAWGRAKDWRARCCKSRNMPLDVAVGAIFGDKARMLVP